MHSKAMEIMYHEHQVILKAIHQLKSILERENVTDYKSNIIWFINFFKEYGDKFHHHKEEDLLFKVLEKKNEMLGGGLVNELIEHHEGFRKYLQEAVHFIHANDFENLKEILNDYTNDLIDHIGAEDDELFVTADMILNETEKNNLYFSFVDKDTELNMGVKNKFEHSILNSEYL